MNATLEPPKSNNRMISPTFITAGCLRRIQDEQAQRRPKRFAFLFHTAAGKASHSW